ncbi:MAG: hypothetical protein CVU69_04070 [Deltaproteobacteria bacterium HGW-Deltaproteobacteria-4]|nr:MAG: hypothetical protein CVU69_04070 [Deltaproteobacteria bacterium HGW-Deltaproteobacteria-4]
MKPDSLFLREAWRLFFFLGIILINYPFVQIFDKPILIAGIPLLLLYFLVGWPLSIFVIFIFSRYHSNDHNHNKEKG